MIHPIHSSVSTSLFPSGQMKHMTRNLNLFLMGGTNDIKINTHSVSDPAVFEESMFLNVLSQSLHTNVIISNIPHRRDPNVNTVIKEFNSKLHQLVEDMSKNLRPRET